MLDLCPWKLVPKIDLSSFLSVPLCGEPGNPGSSLRCKVSLSRAPSTFSKLILNETSAEFVDRGLDKVMEIEIDKTVFHKCFDKLGWLGHQWL